MRRRELTRPNTQTGKCTSPQPGPLEKDDDAFCLACRRGSVSSPAVQPILALLACPVGGNPMQYVVEKAFAHLNLDWRFLSLEVAPEGLADAVRGMRAMGFRGGTIADPHRRTVLPLLDGTTDTAALLGSVNFVLGEENRLLGDNTEGRGLVESLRRVTDPAGKRCLVLDAGELAQAVAVELASAGAAEIRIADPSAEQAAAAAGLLAGKFPAAVSSLAWEGSFHVPEDVEIVVRSTPCRSSRTMPTAPAGRCGQPSSRVDRGRPGRQSR